MNAARFARFAPPETAHTLALAWARLRPWRARLRPRPTELGAGAGLRAPNPLGLAAGMDKNARALAAWFRMGFGFVEVGAITPSPRKGNPRPRLWRLTRERALVNAMGLPNDGLVAVRARVARWRARGGAGLVGANIAPDDVRDCPLADYAALAAGLRDVADYLTINVSSPNAPGLRDWAAPDNVKAATERTKEAFAGAVFVKLSPDTDEEIMARVARAALEGGADGFIATNTTARHDAPYAGGLSGAPLFARALGAVRALGALGAPVIGVGGVRDAKGLDAMLKAGARAVQIYTALAYEGFGAPARMLRNSAG